MRALLDVIRENEVQVQKMAEGVAVAFLFDNSYRHKAAGVLKQASLYLKVLDPELGDEELIKAVAVELAKLLR